MSQGAGPPPRLGTPPRGVQTPPRLGVPPPSQGAGLPAGKIPTPPKPPTPVGYLRTSDTGEEVGASSLASDSAVVPQVLFDPKRQPAEELCVELGELDDNACKVIRILVRKKISPWIIAIIQEDSLLSMHDLQFINQEYLKYLVGRRPLECEYHEATSQVTPIPQVVQGLSFAMDPGWVHQPDPPGITKIRDFSKLDIVNSKRVVAAQKARDLVMRMGRSSDIYQRIVSGEWDQQDLLIAITRGTLKGPTIEGHPRVLLRFERYASSRTKDPWNAQAGTGPDRLLVESFVKNGYLTLQRNNEGLPQEEKQGKSVIKCFPSDFKYGESCLGLTFPKGSYQLLYGYGSKAWVDFGHMSKAATPFSMYVIIAFERIVNGLEPEATRLDKVFVGSLLFCIFIARRFDDIQSFAMRDLLPIYSGEPASHLMDKTSTFTPKWARLSSEDHVEREWLTPWLCAYRDSDWSKSYLVPRPSDQYSKYYKNHQGATEPCPTSKAIEWLSRTMTFSVCNECIPPTERRRILKNPRIQACRHTLPTLLASLGFSQYDVQEVTGHLTVACARHYSSRAYERQRAMRTDAISYARQMAGLAQPDENPIPQPHTQHTPYSFQWKKNPPMNLLQQGIPPSDMQEPDENPGPSGSSSSFRTTRDGENHNPISQIFKRIRTYKENSILFQGPRK